MIVVSLALHAERLLTSRCRPLSGADAFCYFQLAQDSGLTSAAQRYTMVRDLLTPKERR